MTYFVARLCFSGNRCICCLLYHCFSASIMGSRSCRGKEWDNSRIPAKTFLSPELSNMMLMRPAWLRNQRLSSPRSMDINTSNPFNPGPSLLPPPRFECWRETPLLPAREQDLLGKLKEGMDPGFRLFITALPNNEFPLGLLQMCTKVRAGTIRGASFVVGPLSPLETLCRSPRHASPPARSRVPGCLLSAPMQLVSAAVPGAAPPFVQSFYFRMSGGIGFLDHERLSSNPTSRCHPFVRQSPDQVTNEPPAGLKAGILRSYTVIVDQERLERVETAQWRQLLYALCFLHSVVRDWPVGNTRLENLSPRT